MLRPCQLLVQEEVQIGKDYNELGWESLYSRRWYHRLCHFFNLKDRQSPGYLFSKIPVERHMNYNCRRVRTYTPSCGRTIHFSETYFSNVIYEWNLLDSDTRCSRSISEFKRRLLCKIRPTENCVFSIYDIEGVKMLTKLRLQFSVLNEHRFRHRSNAISPMCNCGTGKEDNIHFLLHCPLYNDIRLNLHDEISEVLGLDIRNHDDDFFCSLPLYGSDDFPSIINKMILEATIKYMKSSKRFQSANDGS